VLAGHEPHRPRQCRGQAQLTTGPQGLRGVPPGGVQYAFLWVIVEVGVVHVTDAAANIVGVIACGKQCGDSARESGSAGRKGGDIWREGGATTPCMRRMRSKTF
jgi:hypothetical protein